MISCSAPIVKESTPEEQLAEAREDLDNKRYQKAYETLEGLRYVTAGTRVGAEVQFLLGEASYKSGKYPEAESHYTIYLSTYPGGTFSEKALYMQAMAKIKQLQKRKFFTLKAYTPHDRDTSLLREARALFEIYVESYPAGEFVEPAREKARELLVKEGRHELDIASFYMKKKSPGSALARARRVLEGNYPDEIKEEARDLIDKAEKSLEASGEGQIR